MSQVADYNIANASGASVRSDLNAVFDAIKTLNSGGSDPTNTESFMPYVDTADNNNLKIRNSSNNGFTTIGPVDSANLGLLLRSGGTMTGQLLADDSSGESSPALSFDGDTDTGLYRSGANTIGFSTAGTQKLQVDSSGLTILGDSSASRSLVLREASNNGTNTVSIKSLNSLGSSYTLTLPPNDGSSGQFLQTNGSGVLSFATVSTFSGAASALTGNTLASGVTASSLTSVGTLTGLSVNGGLTVSQNITANGNINGDGNTDISSINAIVATTLKATQFRSDDSSTPMFQNSSGTETAAGRLVRMSVNFTSYRGGNAGDNYTSIRRSFNVSSITDNSEGNFTINFSTSLPSGATTAGMIDLDRFTFNDHCTLYLENTTGAGTGSVRVRICSSANSSHVLDKNSVNVVCFA